jgi:hypothetical protein
MKGFVGIFERYSLPPEPGPILTAWRKLRAMKTDFASAVIVSVGVHSVLGLSLLLIPANLGEHPRETDAATLERAVADVAEERPGDPEMEAFLAEAGRSGLLADLQNLKIQGVGPAAEAKTEVYKALLKASLAARGKSLIELLRKNPMLILPDGSLAFVSGGGASPLETAVGVLSRKDRAALQEAARLANVRRTEKGYLADGNLVRVQTLKGNEIVPADYFFRNCPYEKILAWGADLFSFTSGSSLDLEGAGAPGAKRGAVPAPGAAAESLGARSVAINADPNLIRMIFVRRAAMSGPSGRAESVAAVGGGPRPAPDRAAILDRLMPLPEDEQVTVFIRDHLEGADPDDPETAELVRAFFQNNLNTIIFDISELAAAFDYLEELYYNKALSNRIAALWDSLRGTRTGTECLLYFAGQYDFERRALERLLAARGEAEAFLDGRSPKAEVYKKARKCQIVRDVGRKVRAEIERRGYGAPADVLNAYYREQERIYAFLIGSGGENRDRGLLAQGCYYWGIERYDLAVRSWMEIRPSFVNPLFVKIRGVLSGAESHDIKMMRIQNILVWEDLRGSDEFLLRLVKFGKWKTRGGQ